MSWRALGVGLLSLAALLTAGAIPIAKRLETDLSPARLLVRGDPDEALRLRIEEEFRSTWSPIVLLFATERGEPIATRERLAALEALGDAIEGLPRVRRVVHASNVEVAVGSEDAVEVRRLLDPDASLDLAARRDRALGHPLLRRRVLSDRGDAAALLVETEDLSPDASRELVAAVLERADAHAVPGTRVLATGFPVVHSAYYDLIEGAQARLLPAAVGVIVAALAWAFRSPVGVAAPLLAVGLACVWTFAIMAGAGLPVTLLGTMIPVLTLVIGVSSSIHLLAAFGEARAAGADRAAAASEMLRRAGVACFLATLTTAVGFASLGAARINLIREYGAAAATGVLCALAASLLVLPGGLVFARRGPRKPQPAGRLERALAALVRGVQARPRAVLGAAAGVTLLCIGLATRVRNDEYIGGEVDAGHPIERAIALADSHFAGVGGFVVSLRARDGDLLDPAVLEGISGLQDAIGALPPVRHTLSFVDYLEDLNRVFHEDRDEHERPPDSRALAAQFLLLLEGGDGADELPRLLSFDRSWAVIEVGVRDVGNRAVLELHDEIRRRLAERPIPNVEALLGGRGVVYPKAGLQTVRDLIASFSLAFAVIFVVLLVVLRSLALAAIAMIPNLIPTAVCLAYMGAFDVTLRIGTAVCFSAVLGIAVDDTIHFLLRYRRELRESGESRAAAERTVRTVGRPIVLTSAVLVLGFLAYAGSPFDTHRQLAILTALALSVAVVADLAVLPALLAVLVRAPRPRGA